MKVTPSNEIKFDKNIFNVVVNKHQKIYIFQSVYLDEIKPNDKIYQSHDTDSLHKSILYFENYKNYVSNFIRC